MKLLKKLSNCSEKEISDAYLGFGIIKAMNYATQKRGHLILISLRGGSFLKTIFVSL